MKRKSFAIAAAALLLLAAGCHDRIARKPFSGPERDRVKEVADDRVVDLAERSDPERVAVVAVFDRDAFLGYAQALEEGGIQVLNEFGKAALLLASGPQLRVLVLSPNIRRIAFFARHGRLGRLDPALELSLLKRASEGKEKGAISAVVRFGAPPSEAARKTVGEAGISVTAAQGAAWTVTGPSTAIPRLLDFDEIIYVESAWK